jgi:hypothetical protein
MALTDTQIRRSKPTAGQYKLADGGACFCSQPRPVANSGVCKLMWLRGWLNPPQSPTQDPGGRSRKAITLGLSKLSGNDVI